MIYSNIVKKNFCGRNNNKIQPVEFDFQKSSKITIQWIDSNNQIVDAPSGNLYITASKSTFKRAQNSLLFYSNTFTRNQDNSITFDIDSYTQNYMEQISCPTIAKVQVGRYDTDRQVIIRDIGLMMPRVYIDGLAPSVVVDYYTAAQVDAKISGLATTTLSNTDGNITLTLSSHNYDVNLASGFTDPLASKAWVEEKGYLTGFTETDPVYTAQKSTLATKTWVGDQGFATESWVQGKNYLTSQTDPVYTAEKSTLATKTWVGDQGFATETWVSQQGFATQSSVSQTYATKSQLPTKTSDLTNDSGFIINTNAYLALGNSSRPTYPNWTGWSDGTNVGEITIDAVSGYVAFFDVGTHSGSLHMPSTVLVNDTRTYSDTQVYTFELWIANSGSTDITTISFTSSTLTIIDQESLPEKIQAGKTCVFTVRVYGSTKLINYSFTF